MVRRDLVGEIILAVGVVNVTGRFSVAAALTQPAPATDSFMVPLPSEYRPGPAFVDAAPSPFHRGATSVSLAMEGLSITNTNTDTLGFIDVGAEYFISRAVSANFNFAFSAAALEWPDDGQLCDTRVRIRSYFGLVGLRAHLIRRSDFSFYVDGGLGGLHAFDPFPENGVRSNWMQAVGAGFTLRSEQLSLRRSPVRPARLRLLRQAEDSFVQLGPILYWSRAEVVKSERECSRKPEFSSLLFLLVVPPPRLEAHLLEPG